MDSIEQLLKLPTETLSILAAGYMSYRVAFTGRDGEHSSVDVVFLTFVFAFCARVASSIPVFSPWPIGASIFGVISAIVCAAIWRRWLDGFTFQLLRRTGVSSADRHLSAWQTILTRGAKNPTQLIVKTTGGTFLMCEKLSDFSTAPMGPCVLGTDGSVALYVTHSRAPEQEWEECLPFEEAHADWGHEMTYIPSAEVAEIRLRSVR